MAGTSGTTGLCSLLSRLSPHCWLLGSARLAGIQASVSPSVLWEPSLDGLEAPLAHALQAPQGWGLQRILRPHCTGEQRTGQVGGRCAS